MQFWFQMSGWKVAALAWVIGRTKSPLLHSLCDVKHFIQPSGSVYPGALLSIRPEWPLKVWNSRVHLYFTKLPFSLAPAIGPGVFPALDAWQLVVVFSVSEIQFFTLLSLQNLTSSSYLPTPTLGLGRGDFLCESRASYNLYLLLFIGLKETLGLTIWKL